jgi:hypothetical protein
MVLPDPPEVPVIPPVMVPIAQTKLLGIVEVNAIFVENPLQMLIAEVLVITGFGLIVRVTVKTFPRHPNVLTPCIV